MALTQSPELKAHNTKCNLYSSSKTLEKSSPMVLPGGSSIPILEALQLCKFEIVPQMGPLKESKCIHLTDTL